MVPVVARLLSHPVLGKQARYVLCRLGGSEAVAALMADAPARPVNEALEYLEHLGAAAAALLSQDFSAAIAAALGAAPP